MGREKSSLETRQFAALAEYSRATYWDEHSVIVLGGKLATARAHHRASDESSYITGIDLQMAALWLV